MAKIEIIPWDLWGDDQVRSRALRRLCRGHNGRIELRREPLLTYVWRRILALLGIGQ